MEIYRNETLSATRPITQGDAPQHDTSFKWVSYFGSGLAAPQLQAQNTDTPTPTLTPTQTASPTFTPAPPPWGPVTINYIFDPLNRLTEANYSNGDYYHYTGVYPDCGCLAPRAEGMPSATGRRRVNPSWVS